MALVNEHFLKLPGSYLFSDIAKKVNTFRITHPFSTLNFYKDGTVFIEGLAYFKNKLYLYYGCADSQVAVAICDDNIDSKLKTHN